MRKYHALTVHYGPEHPTKTLVEQLLTSLDPSGRIIVVDHADTPLQSPWPPERVTVVRPTENAGYAAGVNLGLGVLLGKRVPPEDIVLVMNNDITMRPETLATIQGWWEKIMQPTIAGIKRGHVDLLTGRSHVAPEPHASRRYIPYLHGSFLSASLNTFLVLQGLPNYFFLYWEDVLFSLRAEQMGIPLRTIPGADINHNDSPAEVSDTQLYYLVRSGALFLSRSSPRPWRWLWWAANAGRRLYHALRPTTVRVTTVRRALRDAAHGRTGKRL